MITFLDFSKNHVARPPAHKLGLLCKIDFPKIENTRHTYLLTLFIWYCYFLGIKDVYGNGDSLLFVWVETDWSGKKVSEDYVRKWVPSDDANDNSKSTV